jgi:isocitrate dehydrogenase (NAD+)
VANPSALLMAAIMMLEHLDQREPAQRIRAALEATIRENDNLTPDLKGTGTTQSFTDAVIRRLGTS